MERIIEAFTIEMGAGFFTHLIVHYAIVFALFLLTIVLVFADLSYAISTAKRLGERIRSRKLRKSIDKILRYWGLQLLASILGSFGLLFKGYDLPYLTMFITLIIVIIEGKSLWEHFRRRKDHMSKIPETIEEMIDFVGSEAEFKSIITEIARRKLTEKLSKP